MRSTYLEFDESFSKIKTTPSSPKSKHRDHMTWLGALSQSEQWKNVTYVVTGSAKMDNFAIFPRAKLPRKIAKKSFLRL